MATYIWDLGFDFNAVANANGECFLANGLVLINAALGSGTKLGNVPATPVGLVAGQDMVGWNAFNITSNPQAGSYKIIEGQIIFSNAVLPQVDKSSGKTITSPFNDSSGDFLTSISFPQKQQPDVTGDSVIFSGVQAPEGEEALVSPSSFPEFPVYFGPVPTGAPPGTVFEVVNPGRFIMTLSLTVQTPDGSKQITFVDDPEMIVSGL